MLFELVMGLLSLAEGALGGRFLHLSCLEMSLRYRKVKDWHLSGYSNSGWRLTAESARTIRSSKTV